MSRPCRFPAISAPVAQLDRVPDYESGCRRFESFRARHFRPTAGPDAIAAAPQPVDANRLLLRRVGPTRRYSRGRPRQLTRASSRRGPINDRPVAPALAAQLAALVDQARGAQGAFEPAMQMPSGSRRAPGAPQSEGWMSPQQALSAAIAARKLTALAQGDIDALAARALQTAGRDCPTALRPSTTHPRRSKRFRPRRPRASQRCSSGSGVKLLSAADQRQQAGMVVGPRLEPGARP